MKFIVTNSQHFTPQSLDKCIQFYALCLTPIKHGTIRNILFPHIIWFQNNKVVQSRRINAPVFHTFAMSIADVSLVDRFGIQISHVGNVVAPAYNMVA